MKAQWYSLWYSGEYRSLPYIWQTWHTLVSEFFDQHGLTITHFGAGSAKFRSGKYLQYQRGRKRLLQAFTDRDNFRHLSFLEMQSESYTTLAGDNSFRATLSANDAEGVEVDVRLDHHSQKLCDSFRSVAEQLFSKARLITFKTPARINGIPYLPCNLPGNYDGPGSDIAEEYLDVTTTYIESS